VGLRPECDTSGSDNIQSVGEGERKCTSYVVDGLRSRGFNSGPKAHIQAASVSCTVPSACLDNTAVLFSYRAYAHIIKGMFKTYTRRRKRNNVEGYNQNVKKKTHSKVELDEGRFEACKRNVQRFKICALKVTETKASDWGKECRPRL